MVETGPEDSSVTAILIGKIHQRFHGDLRRTKMLDEATKDFIPASTLGMYIQYFLVRFSAFVVVVILRIVSLLLLVVVVVVVHASLLLVLARIAIDGHPSWDCLKRMLLLFFASVFHLGCACCLRWTRRREVAVVRRQRRVRATRVVIDLFLALLTVRSAVLR
jgi:hypothetical protein